MSACPSGTLCDTTRHPERRRRHPGQPDAPGQVRRRQPRPDLLRARPERVPAGLLDEGLLRPARPAQRRRGRNTDYYLYNPHARPSPSTGKARSSSGSFTIPATPPCRSGRRPAAPCPSTRASTSREATCSGESASATAGGATYEWGYSLLPSTFLYREHFLGWAPGVDPHRHRRQPGRPGQRRRLPHRRPGQHAGLRRLRQRRHRGPDRRQPRRPPESAYVTLNRLQTQFFYDPANAAGGGDLSQAHFWATGDFTMAYGENADTATTSTPSLDLGYIAIPGTDFVSLVLTVDKSVDPQVVPTAVRVHGDVHAPSELPEVHGRRRGRHRHPAAELGVRGGHAPRITLPTRRHAHRPRRHPGAGTVASPYVLAWSSARSAEHGREPGDHDHVHRPDDGGARRGHAEPEPGAGGRHADGGRRRRRPSRPPTSPTWPPATPRRSPRPRRADAALPGGPLHLHGDGHQPGRGTALTGVSLFDAMPAGVTAVAGTTSLQPLVRRRRLRHRGLHEQHRHEELGRADGSTARVTAPRRAASRSPGVGCA